MKPFKISISINICKRHIMNNIINNSRHANRINCLLYLKYSIISNQSINITNEPMNQTFVFKKKPGNKTNNL